LLYVQVIIPLSLPKLFTYAVDDAYAHQIAPGKRVLVQFGKQKIYAAIILKLVAKEHPDYEVKSIISVLDELPVVTPTQLDLWEWMHNYYLCTMGDIMLAALPAALRINSETKIKLNPVAHGGTIHLTDDEFLIMEALHQVKELSLKEISKILDRKHVFPVVRSLLKKNQVISSEDVKDDFKFPLITVVSRTEQMYDQAFLKAQFDRLEQKAPKQLDILMKLMQLEKDFDQGKVPQKVLLKSAQATLASLQPLIKKGLLALSTERATKASHHHQHDFYELSASQQQALFKIQENFKEKDVVLLHGVTSSGKTEIYIRLIDEYLKHGQQVLYLLPEIALTTQIISRLEKHFGNQLLIYHSRFSDQERATIWSTLNESAQTNKPYVIVGARSAIFLPFHNPGLIIVDEEHETSYKQFDPAPRYHARDVAIVLGKLHQAKVLLGSATPSIESYFNAINGKYALTELFARHADIEAPLIKLINIKELTFKKQMKSHFSPMLIKSMKEELERGKQIILFQNRRGYAPIIQCNQCNWIPHCNNCDVALTYYRKNDLLRCHYCGFTTQLPKSCKQCGNTDLRQHGFGTEKIEDELQIFFPDHKIARLDLDTTRGKHAYTEIIQRFENRETDILVGTQMVTKGLDFDNVSLVGILNADNLINFPDFRAYERSFQMLMQVSGRSGRKSEQGNVIIQTYNPSHSILDFVVKNDYKAFFDFEIAERKKFNYPPYCRLIELTLKGKDETKTDQASILLAKKLKQHFKQLLGPVTPVVGKIKNYYIRTILLKTTRNIPSASIRQQISDAVNEFRLTESAKGIILQADVDPL
jgi:primosomal protein N' (replication factor Y)